MTREKTALPKRAAPMFVRREVDEYGLTSSQFRVLGRIARRGRCTESVTNMARGCQLHPDTVRAALKALTAFCMLRQTRRTGQTSIYELTPVSAYVPREHPAETEPLPSSQGGGMETKGGHPLETKGAKGSPIKVLQEGEGPPVCASEEKKKGHRVYPSDLKAQITALDELIAAKRRCGFEDATGCLKFPNESDRIEYRALKDKRAKAVEALAKLDLT